MSICTFFGHRICSQNIEGTLEKTILDLIENNGVRVFYVGNNGDFDRIVTSVLRRMCLSYKNIEYYTVLAYLPTNNEYDNTNTHTILPEGIELVHPRFAIDKRNRWMVEQAQFVITYTVNTFGGAYKFSQLAQRKGKTVINIADIYN